MATAGPHPPQSLSTAIGSRSGFVLCGPLRFTHADARGPLCEDQSMPAATEPVLLVEKDPAGFAVDRTEVEAAHDALCPLLGDAVTPRVGCHGIARWVFA